MAGWFNARSYSTRSHAATMARIRTWVDAAVTLTEDIMRSGFGYFGTLARLKEQIEAIIGKSVDFVSEPVEKESLHLAMDRAHAF